MKCRGVVLTCSIWTFHNTKFTGFQPCFITARFAANFDSRSSFLRTLTTLHKRWLILTQMCQEPNFHWFYYNTVVIITKHVKRVRFSGKRKMPHLLVVKIKCCICQQKKAREHEKTAGYFDTNATDMRLVSLCKKQKHLIWFQWMCVCVSSRVLSQPSFNSHDRKENHTVTESPQSTWLHKGHIPLPLTYFFFQLFPIFYTRWSLSTTSSSLNWGNK